MLNYMRLRTTNDIVLKKWFSTTGNSHALIPSVNTIANNLISSRRPFHDGIPRFASLLAICINQYPITPRSEKKILLKVSDVSLKGVLDRLLRLDSPYIGLFLSTEQSVKDKSKPIEFFANHHLSNVRSEKIGEFPGIDNVHTMGTISEFSRLGSQFQKLYQNAGVVTKDEILYQVSALDRVRIQSMQDSSLVPVANVAYPTESFEYIDSNVDTIENVAIDKIDSYRRTFKETLGNIAISAEKVGVQLRIPILDGHTAGDFCDIVVGFVNSTLKKDSVQAVLDELDITKRLELVDDMLLVEQQFWKDMYDRQQQFEERRRLREEEESLKVQYDIIRKKLGLDQKQDVEIGKLRKILKSKNPNEETERLINEEIEKLSRLHVDSSEYSTTRTHLEWLVSIPWGIYSDEIYDIKKAQDQLDSDHYGLQDVKDRILEFVAVNRMLQDQVDNSSKKTHQGRILCLVGPPGVGKTSIGKSISKALNREFFRFSIGGVDDVSEIKGHRRTYVGALPGKFIQALKRTETSNPVILIDEIDKISRSSRGDPTAALLEALDPEQNSKFHDHYIDYPVDFSRVLFICTANSESTISEPLADRMEFIRLSGYIFQEKLEIAKKYLWPKCLAACGIDKKLEVDDDTLTLLIKDYSREAGVRGLEKLIEKICRKVTRKLLEDKELEKIQLTRHNLNEFVGNPIYMSQQLYDEPLVGVACGLAYDSLGGSTVYIEVSRDSMLDSTRKQGSLKTTGRMAEVMQESTQIAYTVAKRVLAERNDAFGKEELHMHLPSGSIKKDGPSAGAAMALALVSFGINKPIIPNFALTGELTLMGKITKIGGVREKLVGANRANIKKIALPLENKSEFDEVPDVLKEGIEVVFVNTFEDLLRIAFPLEFPSR